MEEMETTNPFIQSPNVMATYPFPIYFLSATDRYPVEKDILQAMVLNKCV